MGQARGRAPRLDILTSSYSKLFFLLLLLDGVASGEMALLVFAVEAGMVSTGGASASAAMATLDWQLRGQNDRQTAVRKRRFVCSSTRRQRISDSFARSFTGRRAGHCNLSRAFNAIAYRISVPGSWPRKYHSPGSAHSPPDARSCQIVHGRHSDTPAVSSSVSSVRTSCPTSFCQD